MSSTSNGLQHYLVASDFDQTLSFNDSGIVLSELLGIQGFQEKVAGLSKSSLVQQGAELTYLLRHDPEFRRVRREHLAKVGKLVPLKKNVDRFVEFLSAGIDGCRFTFCVISASPVEVVRSALEGIVPTERIFGTDLEYDSETGEISSVIRTPAGYGKVVVLTELESRLQMRPDHTIYIGDGSSDVFVMQHVNHRGGYSIAVSETKFVARIAKRTVLSDNALSVLVPILEDILGWDSARIRELFASYGLTLHEWDKVRTDSLTFLEAAGGADHAAA